MSGYFRYPDISDNQVVFTSEDDLWLAPVDGGRAERLTKTRGTAVHPAFSPEGKSIAFTGTEEGSSEVFVVDADGGPIEQLTYTGGTAVVVGWMPEGERIIFRSNFKEPFRKKTVFYTVPKDGGQVERLELGHGKQISFEPDGDRRVISRNEDDLARWKRYRGGRAGQIWIEDSDDSWEQLLPDEEAGLIRPQWIGDRIYFLSDLEGYGNLYSINLEGEDLKRLTDYTGHYPRYLRTDGTKLVYTRAGNLHLYDVDDEEDKKFDVKYPGTRTELNRKFVDASKYFEWFELHPEGHSMAVTARGKFFHFGNWEGAVYQKGTPQGVRYRKPIYIDDETLLVISDEGGDEAFEIFEENSQESVQRFDETADQMGRPLKVEVSPDGDSVAFSNHRYQVFILDLESGELTEVDQSRYGRISGLDWSPNGDYLAYGMPNSKSTSLIRVYKCETDETRDITTGDFVDTEPQFDPEGRYLYFLSRRDFNPVYDEVFFELSFPETTKPFVVTLQTDEDSPFEEKPRPLGGEPASKDDEDEDNGDSDSDEHESSEEDSKQDDSDKSGDEDEVEEDEIEFENIGRRIQSFPVEAARYRGLEATAKRVFWTRYPARRGLSREDDNSSKGGKLRYYSLKKNEEDGFAKKVKAFTIGADNKTLAYWTGSRLRVLKAGGGGASSKNGSKPGRESGWLDLGRISVSVEPKKEWRQMLREAWRLMQQHYWHESMGQNDWDGIWDQYAELLDDVSTRSEFSDLVWTMQGELGTSHAYEMGGDYEIPPQYRPGFLGADVEWDSDIEHDDLDSTGGYRIERLIHGEGWEKGATSPLLKPGTNIHEGDILVSINGRHLDSTHLIQEALVNEAGKEVDIEVLHTDDRDEVKSYTVEPLSSEFKARYRDWVRRNRETVHRQTDGRVGYIHIPDMGATGYSEFHRSFISEKEREGYIIDVRFNGGGNVSELILEKLARKRLGYTVRRWGEPMPYPSGSMNGPLVALTNAYAGSDGDIFSHCFKMMDLGPLLGTRTWGGVVGIWPRHQLVDGSVTTQPEFSFWFNDVGFGVENYGTDPDIEIERPPGEFGPEDDKQLQRAIDKAEDSIDDEPAHPDFEPYPDMSPLEAPF